MWKHNHLAVKWSPREIIKRPDDPWCIYCRWATHLQQWNTIYRRVNWWFLRGKPSFFSLFIGDGEWVNDVSWSWFSNDFAQPNNFSWPWPSFFRANHRFFIYLWVMVMVSIVMLNNHKASQLNLSHVAWRLCDTPYKVMPHGPQLNWQLGSVLNLLLGII